MVIITQRRAADSGTVRLICLAIHYLQRERRLPPTEDRIVAHIIDKNQHLFGSSGVTNNGSEFILTEAYIKGQLQLARVDGLVQLVRHNPANGGPEILCHIVPNDFPGTTSAAGANTHDRNRDWYCFDCHGSGEVVACDKCQRVYHPQCLPNTNQSWLDMQYLLCPACDLLERPVARRLKRNALGASQNSKLVNGNNPNIGIEDRSVINGVATIIVAKLEQLFADLKFLEPDHIRPQQGVPNERDFAFERKIYNRLVFDSFDLNKISRKARYQHYANIEEFRIDLQTIAHCVLVYYGKDCIQYVRKIDDLLETARKELHLTTLCPQCYRSRHDATPNWFSIPCSPPHALVYAPYRHPIDAAAANNNNNNNNDAVIKSNENSNGPTIYFPAKIMRRGKQQHQTVEIVYFGTHEMVKLVAPHTQVLINANDPTVSCPAPPLSASGGGKSTRGSTAANPTAAEWQRAVDELERYRRNLASNAFTQSPNNSNSNGGGGSHEAGTLPRGGKRIRNEGGQNGMSPALSNSSLHGGRGQPGLGGVGIEVSIQTDPGEFDDDKPPLRHGKSGGATASSTKEYQVKLREALEREQGKHEKQLAQTVKKMTEEQDRAVAECKKHLEKSFAEREQKTKAQQWCRNCWKEAIYHCCWNNSYCSQECQQKHWYSEHKKQCKRKLQQQNQQQAGSGGGTPQSAAQRG